MEPRVFTRGNAVPAARCEKRRRGFNGATRLHAWKHPDFCRHWTPDQVASMEPRVFTRGNHKPSNPLRGSQARFNGATRLHAWKLAVERVLQRLKGARFNGATRLHAWKHVRRQYINTRRGASMEPRVFTR